MLAVTLDAGGTLLVPHPSVGAVYAAAGRRHGVRADAAELERRFAAAWRDRPRPFAISPEGARASWRRVVEATFAGLAPPGALDALFADLWATFARPSSWRLVEEAVDLVARLHAEGFRTAVVSNWDDRLPRLLAALGLTPHLDAVVISAEVGVEKPDPRIFEEALRRLGVRPDEAVHVGNDPEADGRGARLAGLSLVLLGRDAPDLAAAGRLLYARLPLRTRPVPRGGGLAKKPGHGGRANRDRR